MSNVHLCSEKTNFGLTIVKFDYLSTIDTVLWFVYAPVGQLMIVQFNMFKSHFNLTGEFVEDF